MKTAKTTRTSQTASKTRSKRPASKSTAKTAVPAHPLARAKHHAKRAYHLTPKFIHGMVTGAFIGIMLVTGLRASGSADALSIVSARDCDSNAVIACGALTTKELSDRYSYKGVASIYKYFGISAEEVKAMGSTASAGLVHKNGNITVGGKLVATGAITAGRENISGSTKVSSGGVTFYKRAPSVSFRQDSLSAFVVLKDGIFQYAILGACGNPVAGAPTKKTPTPTPPVTSKPTPQPPVVPPTTPVPPETPTTEISTQTPESTPVQPPVVTTAAAVTELPKTGAGSAVTIFLLAVIGGYIFHVVHHKSRRRRQSRLTHLSS
jgi:hypothetical protein